MDREGNNPYTAPQASGVSVKQTDDAPNSLPIKAVWARIFLDAVCILLACAAALFIRFDGDWAAVSSVAALCVRSTFMLTAVSLFGILLFGGYSARYLNTSLRPVIGIVVFGVLLGIAPVLLRMQPTKTFFWPELLVNIPRTVVMMAIVFGAVLVAIARRSIQLRIR